MTGHTVAEQAIIALTVASAIGSVLGIVLALSLLVHEKWIGAAGLATGRVPGLLLGSVLMGNTSGFVYAVIA